MARIIISCCLLLLVAGCEYHTDESCTVPFVLNGIDGQPAENVVMVSFVESNSCFTYAQIEKEKLRTVRIEKIYRLDPGNSTIFLPRTVSGGGMFWIIQNEQRRCLSFCPGHKAGVMCNMLNIDLKRPPQRITANLCAFSKRAHPYMTDTDRLNLLLTDVELWAEFQRWYSFGRNRDEIKTICQTVLLDAAAFVKRYPRHKWSDLENKTLDWCAKIYDKDVAYLAEKTLPTTTATSSLTENPSDIKFDSAIPLQIWVKPANSSAYHNAGRTPAEFPIVIPSGADWYIEPGSEFNVRTAECIDEMNYYSVPGIDLYPDVKPENIAQLANVPSLKYLDISTHNLQDGDLVHFAKLVQLRKIKFLHGMFDSNFGCIAKLPNLESISFLDMNPQILKALRQTPKLRELKFHTNWLVETDLAYLEEMPNLRSLSLEGANISDDWLKRLRKLKKLEELAIRPWQINLAELGDMPALKSLKISSCKIGSDSLASLANMKKLRSLSLVGIKDIGDEQIMQLAALAGLERLELRKINISDAGLKFLKNLPRLRVLIIDEVPVCGVGLENIESPDKIEQLELTGPNVSDSGVAPLAKMSGLESLSLEGKFDDDGVAYIKNLSKLRILRLSGGITNAGLTYLSGMEKLEELTITNTQIDDAGLVYLKNLRQMQRLDLQGNRIAGEGLVHLGGMHNLLFLDLMGNPITDEGISHFHVPEKYFMIDLSETKLTPEAKEKLMMTNGLRVFTLTPPQTPPATTQPTSAKLGQ